MRSSYTPGRTAAKFNVHAKMHCTQCHGSEDIHGDGKIYKSMRDTGAVKADCMQCHRKGINGARKYNPKNPSHGSHKTLACMACHVSNELACTNCHFDRFRKDRNPKGTFFKTRGSMLLVNYHGKITSGTALTLVSGGKKYLTFAPTDFKHSVARKGKKCGACHGTAEAKALAAGKTVTMTAFRNGALVSRKGVIPLVAGKLKYTFAQKIGGKWVEMKGGGKPTVTLSGYAKPLTAKQLKLLSIKMD
jgi:hypothetical protein